MKKFWSLWLTIVALVALIAMATSTSTKKTSRFCLPRAFHRPILGHRRGTPVVSLGRRPMIADNSGLSLSVETAIC